MGFSPKNYREPEITIPAKLVTSLKVEREKRVNAVISWLIGLAGVVASLFMFEGHF